MKIAHNLTLMSLLLAAGCSSYHERQAQNDNYRYSSGNYGAYGNVGGTSSSSSATETSSASDTSRTGSFQSQNQPYQPATSGSFNSQSTTVGDTMVSQVQQQLRQDPTLAAVVPNLQMTAQNGTLTLTGTVPSEQEKTRIETIAKSVPGVVNVNNQLAVSSQSQFTQPGTTENKFAAGGTSEQSTSGQSTGNLSSQESTAQSQAQPSASERTSAEQAALAQSSQSSTNSSDTTANQELSPTSDRTGSSRVYGTNQDFPRITATTEADRTLGQQIVQELKTDPAMAALFPTLKITVESSKITLRGTVKSEDEKKKIESAVQRVTGVSSIDDQLVVGAGGPDTGTNPSNQ